MATKLRIKWVDIAKGIAIILVIVGHTTEVDLTRGLIFSFHMPLFFITSAYTMKYSETIEMFVDRNLKSIAKMLSIAYGLFICRKILLIAIGRNTFLGVRDFVISAARSIIYSRGVDFTNNGILYETIGMTWFLVVLAFAKCLYDLLHLLIKNKYIRGGACLCFMLIGMHFSYLPFSLDTVFVVLLFYYCGDVLNGLLHSDTDKRYIFIEMLISSLIWYVVFRLIYDYTGEYLELSIASYPLGLISFIIAIAGCLMVFDISRLIENLPLLSDILSWLGINSLMILCVHYMDTLWMPYIDNRHKRLYMTLRVIIDIIISTVVVYVRDRVQVFLKERIRDNISER